jgi:proline racemase/trans-L-3-hydroxyproline dehydratase
MYKSDVVVDVPTVGSVTVDIAFGGIFFAMVDAEKLGLELSSTNVSRLVQVALAIRTAINGAVQVRHPSEPTSGRIESVVIYGQARHPEAWQRNIDVFGKGQFDRSPCGTATCARMAILHARGRLDLEQVFVNESIVGSLLKGRLVGVTHIGDYEAVLPEITGVPFIIGLNQWIIDPSDALYDGLAWGEGADR